MRPIGVCKIFNKSKGNIFFLNYLLSNGNKQMKIRSQLIFNNDESLMPRRRISEILIIKEKILFSNWLTKGRHS